MPKAVDAFIERAIVSIGVCKISGTALIGVLSEIGSYRHTDPQIPQISKALVFVGGVAYNVKGRGIVGLPLLIC